MDKGPVDKAVNGVDVALLAKTLGLAQREFEVINAMCDRANVPRTFEGEKLSAAQRVTILEGAWRGLMCCYRGAPPRVVEH